MKTVKNVRFNYVQNLIAETIISRIIISVNRIFYIIYVASINYEATVSTYSLEYHLWEVASIFEHGVQLLITYGYIWDINYMLLYTIQSQEINGTSKLQSTPSRVWPMVYSVFVFSSFDGGSWAEYNVLRTEKICSFCFRKE